MPDIYDDYKPLRNYLRNTNLLNSLGAIRWYVAYHHFEKKDPPHTDMQVDPIFFKEPMNPLIYLAPWHLAVLARELIINAPDTSIVLLHDFRTWKDLAAG